MKIYGLTFILFVCTGGLSVAVTWDIPVTLNLDTTHVTRLPGRCWARTAMYTAGGVTFTYPVGYFASTTPLVLVSVVLKNRAYSATEFVVAEIEDSTASFVKVRVNVAVVAPAPMIGEANTDDVEVQCQAIGL